jgi:CDP-diacylglycerol---glycerol-3-phosphate 3-phosphatidyltransferase
MVLCTKETAARARDAGLMYNSTENMKAVIPNLLSSLRIGLVPAIIFLNPSWRLPLLVIAMVTDFLDGFLARRWAVISKIGTIIDPIGDKAITIAFSYLFWKESILTQGDLVAIFLRDIVIVLFTVFLIVSRQWATWKIQSFICGKVATFLQGILFLCIMCGYGVPSVVVFSLVAAGVIAPFELVFLALRRNDQQLR